MGKKEKNKRKIFFYAYPKNMNEKVFRLVPGNLYSFFLKGVFICVKTLCKLWVRQKLGKQTSVLIPMHRVIRVICSDTGFQLCCLSDTCSHVSARATDPHVLLKNEIGCLLFLHVCAWLQHTAHLYERDSYREDVLDCVFGLFGEGSWIRAHIMVEVLLFWTRVYH